MTDFEQNNSKTAPVVSCQGVQRIYQQDTVPVYALRGADLTINAGEFVSLAGPRARANRPCSTSLVVWTDLMPVVWSLVAWIWVV